MAKTAVGESIATDCSGKVKFFKEDKGFGFIVDEGSGKDVFVHITNVDKDDLPLNENDAVTFDIEQGKKGPSAVNVRKA